MGERVCDPYVPCYPSLKIPGSYNFRSSFPNDQSSILPNNYIKDYHLLHIYLLNSSNSRGFHAFLTYSSEQSDERAVISIPFFSDAMLRNNMVK